MNEYLRDPKFWLAVLVINLCSAPFVGFGRAMAQTLFGS